MTLFIFMQRDRHFSRGCQNYLVKKVIVTIHGLDWQREKWKSGFGSKFIHQGEKNAVKYADEIIVLSKGVQDYFEKEYGRKTVFIQME